MKLSPQDKSMLITFTGASFLVLIFFFLGVKPYEDPIPEAFFEIPMIEEDITENPEVENEKSTENQQKIKSNLVYNSRELRNESRTLFEEKDPIREAIEQQQLGSVEELLSENEKTLEENKKSRELAMAERRELIKSQIEARELERNSKKGNRTSTVSYNLEGRDAIVIPNPVYTCDAQGSIVLDIEVRSTGSISKMEFNKKASTSSNGCLLDQALKYAENALFNSSTSEVQSGTITFYFQG